MLTHTEKLVMAIKSLRPTAEFSIIGGDYSTIKWDVLEGNAPTQKEIDAQIKLMDDAEQSKAEADAVAKQIILDRLGLTADEAKLLLS